MSGQSGGGEGRWIGFANLSFLKPILLLYYVCNLFVMFVANLSCVQQYYCEFIMFVSYFIMSVTYLLCFVANLSCVMVKTWSI